MSNVNEEIESSNIPFFKELEMSSVICRKHRKNWLLYIFLNDLHLQVDNTDQYNYC